MREIVSPVIESMLRSVTHHTAASPSPSNSIGPGSQVVPSFRDTRRDPSPGELGGPDEDHDERLVVAGLVRDDAPGDRCRGRRLEGPHLEARPSERGQDRAVAGGVRGRVSVPARAGSRRRRRRRTRARARRRRRCARLGDEGSTPCRRLLDPLIGQDRHHAIVELRRCGAFQGRPEHAQAVLQRLQLPTAGGTPPEVSTDDEVVGLRRRPEGELREEGTDVVTRRHGPPPLVDSMSAARSSRRRNSAARIRVFAVPTGMPSRSEISALVLPPR